MVLDPHTHAWGPPTPAHPWTNGSLLEIAETFSTPIVYDAGALLGEMDEAGIDEAVVVGYPLPDYRDNWYTRRVAREHDRLYGVVTVDPFEPDAAGALGEDLSEGVLGFRLAPACPQSRMWAEFDPTAEWLYDAMEETAFWEAAVEEDAVCQILVNDPQLDQVVELVDRYPELTYLVDHFARTDPSSPPEEGDFARLADLAEYDVAVKISEAAHVSNEGHPYADVHDHVHWLIEEFGRERVVWGSDYPNVSDVADYRETLTWLDAVDGLSDADREWLTERSFREHVGLR
jgi:predicted TIM-barrel fold metal-dependent hydrolase